MNKQFSGLVIAGPMAGQGFINDAPFYKVVKMPPSPMSVGARPATFLDTKVLTYVWDEGFIYYLGDSKVFTGHLWVLEGWTKADVFVHLYRSYQHFMKGKQNREEQMVLEEIADILKTHVVDQNVFHQNQKIVKLLKEWGFKL